MGKLLAMAVLVTLMTMGAAAKDKMEKKVVELKNAQGQSVGTATLSAGGKGGTKIQLKVKNLTPGEHAIHVHEKPLCEGPAFASAGAHLNPEKKQHGLQNPQGHHVGDMVNFRVKKDGTSRQTINAGFPYTKESAIFANGGTALMIHAKADDHKTDPSGNAGDRIACGVIK